MRHTGIEIRVNKNALTEAEHKALLDDKEVDYQYNAQTGYWTVWIHYDNVFPFKRELFSYLHALHSVHNRKTGTAHLNVFVETSKEYMGEYDREIILEDGNYKYYKNLTVEEFLNTDIDSILLAKELG